MLKKLCNLINWLMLIIVFLFISVFWVVGYIMFSILVYTIRYTPIVTTTLLLLLVLFLVL